MKTKSLLYIVFISFSLNCNAQHTVPQLGKNSIAEVIAAMTLEEKVKLIVGIGMPQDTLANDNGIVGSILGKVAGAAGGTMAFSKFGIPGTIMADGPAGLRIDPSRENDANSYHATAFPIGTLLASSWDTNLIKEVGKALGKEVKEYGIDIHLAPGMNIQRNPLNGRNFEYYSEDPLLSGLLGSAMVKGVQSNGVGSSVKHFAANNQESNRLNINANISERALRELYLKGFEIAVKEANPYTVMSSYNKINGTYAPESYDLLTTILKEEWGFKGGVITDWGGGRNIIAQIQAGNDLIMPGDPVMYQKIVEEVQNGSLDIKIIDKNAARILNVVMQTPSFKNYKYSNKPNLVAHAALSRTAASEGMVLLKNSNNTLPLPKAMKVALYGNASYETIIGGTGSGEVYVAYSIPLLNGLQNIGYTFVGEVASKYVAYLNQDKKEHPKPKKTTGRVRMTPELECSAEDIKKAVTNSDIAIYTLSRNSGEGVDRNVEGDFNLTDREKEMLKTLSETCHSQAKKLIVIINVGGVIETASWSPYADAILLAWQPGQEAGNAIAAIITGVTNPSGKLAQTFPMKYDDVPSAKSFPGTPANRPKEVTYEEGIYVGYRYYNSFNVKPAYEFGYGLSYTNFSYSNLKLSSSVFKDKITATVTITNTGKVAGKEVVQLYLSAPEKTLEKPNEELRAFAKTNLLKPGTSQTITFQLNARDLASYNTDQSSWIADEGKYTVKVGASSQNIKETKQFSLAKDIVVEKTHKALTPQVKINEMSKR